MPYADAAENVLSCAEREKIDVPHELAVIGVDNNPDLCGRTKPTLTSILLDNERAGYLAAELLDQKMRHSRRKVAGGLFGPVCVYHRQSTFLYSRNDDRVAVALKLIRRNGEEPACLAQAGGVNQIATAIFECR